MKTTLVPSSSIRSLMDGRFIQHEHNGTFMGKPYHGFVTATRERSCEPAAAASKG